jgi:hypothetical protein
MSGLHFVQDHDLGDEDDLYPAHLARLRAMLAPLLTRSGIYCLCNHSDEVHGQDLGPCELCRCTVFEHDPLYQPPEAA